MTVIGVSRLFIGGLAFVVTLPAIAATHDQILDNCRQTVGRPLVQACMNYQKGPPTEACRAKASPAVRACYLKASQAQASGVAAPAAPRVT
jgi:hypothetical protein